METTVHGVGAGLSGDHSKAKMSSIGPIFCKKREAIVTNKVTLFGGVRLNEEDFEVKGGRC